MEKSPADVLDEAADWLLIHGRSREVLVDDEGRGCVMWALYGGEGIPNYGVPVRLAEHALHDHLHANGKNPWYTAWNLETEDDFEVIDTLRHVAKDLRNEAAQ